MKTPKEIFSYKKGIKKQIIQSIILIICACAELLIGYISFMRMNFDRDRGDFDLFNDNILEFFGSKVKGYLTIFVAFVLILILAISSIFMFYKSLQILFLRERVVLAKIVQMSIEAYITVGQLLALLDS